MSNQADVTQGIDVVHPGPGARRPVTGGRTLRRVLLAVVLLVVAVIAGLAWVGVDALRARGELKAAAAQVKVVKQTAGNTLGDLATVGDLAEPVLPLTPVVVFTLANPS